MPDDPTTVPIQGHVPARPALFAEPLQHERKVHASSDESAELLGSVVTEPSLVKVEARLCCACRIAR